MAQDEVKTEMVETPAETPKSEAKQPETDVKGAAELEAELEKVRKALKDANKEAAERRKRLDELEESDKKRKEAEMSEAEKVANRIKELETNNAQYQNQLKQYELEKLQNKVGKAVAKELGLPFEQVEPFVDRLRGNTEEELTADAKAVFAVLPKPQEPEKPKQKSQPVTNPAGGEKGETKEQIRERVFGKKGNPFTGGVVTFSEKE